MDTKKLLETLTVDEKLRLINGVGDWHTYDANGKLPSIMMTDGPHGIRKIENEKVGDITGSKKATCYPTACAVASSWNRELAALMARSIAKEAKQEGISVVLGPGINIKRHPLCGRNFEYYSEDPYLAGSLATAYVNAMQDEGVGTSLKHFAANSQETRRMTSNSEVDERALREIYLKAFEMVVKDAKPATIMASYNKLNGDYACANKTLLTDILRNEWFYEGLVVSDWGACVDVVKCFKSGLNLEMPDNRGYHYQKLKEAYVNGEITEEEINKWALKVIEFVTKAELRKSDKDVNFEEHNNIARGIENESAVLLKNEGILPIASGEKIVVVGELAEHMRFQGGGSSHIAPTMHKNAIESFKAAGYEVTYLQGYKNDDDRVTGSLAQETIDYLKKNKDSKVLFFIGLTDTFEGEGYDRDSLEVPFNQVDLLERVSGIVGIKNMAAITIGGAPMDMSFSDNVAAVLHMYLGGQAVGESVADLVSGKANPSGKLAETIPYSIIDVPSFRYFAHRHDDVEYRDSIFVGYRYYETFDVPVRYPFGYGLSYTEFEYTKIEAPEAFEGDDIEVSVAVKNVGKCAGKETVEIYVMPEKENFMRSSIELKGFEKVYLEPGEEKTIKVRLSADAFSAYDVNDHRFKTIAGVYSIAAGASVKDIRLKQMIVVSGEKFSENQIKEYPEYFKPQLRGMDISRETFAKLYGKELSDLKSVKRGEYKLASSFGDVTRASFIGWVFRGIVALAIKVMFIGKKTNNPEMRMIKSGIDEGSIEGLIATSGGIITAKLGDFLVYNANRKWGRAFIRLFTK